MNKRKLKKAIRRLKNLPLNINLIKYAYNKAFHFYLKAKKSTKVAYPSNIMLELTNHCNLACTTCPREHKFGQEMDKGNMPVEKALFIIDQVWPYLDSIGLTGLGETFMYKDLEKVAKYIKRKNKGIIISVSTNAMLPHFKERVKPLVNVLDTIQISIDGIGSVYELIRKNAEFSKLDANLADLVTVCKDSKTDLMLNMVVTKENYFQMADLVRYTNEKGIKYLDFTLFNLASVTHLDIDYYEFYESDEFKNALSELEAAIAEHPAVLVNNWNFTTDNSFQKCPFPWKSFYISWDGFAVPCCGKPFPKELNFGSVFEGRFIDVLNSEAYQRFRRSWFANATPDFCKKCHFVGIRPVSA